MRWNYSCQQHATQGESNDFECLYSNIELFT